MVNPVFGFLDSEGRRGKIRVLVEKLVVRIFFLTDKIYSRFRGLGVGVDLNGLESAQIDEATIAMVWGEMKV